MSEERLQKILAAAGVASRRASEELIVAGRVQVNGQIIRELGTKVDPDKVSIQVDGKSVAIPRRNVYIRVHKPRGVLSDIGGDTRNRTTVESLLPAGTGRVFPVGRLDYNSEGLMLLTDDGALAHRLTHPRFEHPKTYFVLVTQHPTEEALYRLRNGIDIEGGRTSPAEATVAEHLPTGLILDSGDRRGVWLRIVLREGKKRQIRHMISAVDLNLVRLIRWAIGPLTLANLPPGAAQHLTDKERQSLLGTVQSNSRRRRPHRSAGPPKR